jgi:hypothetical protein
MLRPQKVQQPPMHSLESGFSAEIDNIDKAEWHARLPEFDDATFYQTWSYGERSWGSNNLSHIVLKHEGRLVSMAQLRVQAFPLLRMGAAYLNWGPLWRRKDEVENRAYLRNMLRALYQEYVLKRDYALRILPKIYALPDNEGLKEIFSEESFSRGPDSLRTFAVDLRPPIEVIRKDLHKSWKGSLKFAEKQGLVVSEARGPEQIATAIALYEEMKDRKGFYGGDHSGLLEIILDLPETLRPKTLLCSRDGEAIAALTCSTLGKVCFPLTGGTGNKALLYKASFLLFWKMVEQAKERGFDYFDTAGVHEKRNPGGYFFKKGLAGKDAPVMTYIGRFDAYRRYLSYVLFRTAMGLRERAINAARTVKARMSEHPILARARGRRSVGGRDQGTKPSSPSE